MIQMRSILDVADNTGARRASCIGVLGRADRRFADTDTARSAAQRIR